MKSFIVNKNQDGANCIKFFCKILPNAPMSLIYKFLRKGYFELNGKKIKGNEILKINDDIKIFLSDETYDKFAKNFLDKKADSNIQNNNIYIRDDNILQKLGRGSFENYIKHHIIYEDDNVIIFNKPKNMLSENDKNNNFSVNTLLNKYLKNEFSYDEYGKQQKIFSMGVVNRLDRNTEGLIIFSKTYIFSKEITEMIKNHEAHKYYLAYVNGVLNKDGILKNSYKKDKNKNIAIVENINNKIQNVSLQYKIVKKYKNYTLVSIKLITGKSHQIRAQFAYTGHPLLFDKKYMNVGLYKKNEKDFKMKNETQKLIAYKICFGEFENEKLKYLNNKIFEIDDNNIRSFFIDEKI